MGLYAAQGLAGGGDALGAGLTFELFSHATRFPGLKARGASPGWWRGGVSAACPELACALTALRQPANLCISC